MTRITFSTVWGNWPWLRQTPRGDGIWQNIHFQVNAGDDEADWLVVYDEPNKVLRTALPAERRILFISEPSTIKNYKTNYLRQFGVIFTPQKIEALPGETRQMVSQVALLWHYGVAHSHPSHGYETYETLKSMDPPEKKSKISAIISSKTMNQRHRQRIRAADFLKTNLGDDFLLFGHGLEEVDDKSEGIAPYAFHLVFENNSEPNFWTEKIADAYLGWAFPLFSGCPNIGDYFPPDSFMIADLDHPEEILRQVRSVLAQPNFYAERLPAIREARNLVMDRYNLFVVVGAYVTSAQTLPLPRKLDAPVTISPQRFGITEFRRPLRAAKTIQRHIIHRMKNLPFLRPL